MKTRKQGLNLDGVCICFGNTKWAKLSSARKKKAWYDAYVGRRILPDVYEAHFGRGSWQPEIERYAEEGIYLSMLPRVDAEGYVTKVETTKYREIGYSPRPQTTPVKITKDDIGLFVEYLEPLLVPLSDPTARKQEPDVMPEGWTLTSLREGYEALCLAVKKGDLSSVRKFGEYARVIVPECGDLDYHPYVLAAKKKNLPILRELHANGAYIFDTCFIMGKGHVSALRAAVEAKGAAEIAFLLEHGGIGESGTGRWDYGVAGAGYSTDVLADVKSPEVFDVVWDHWTEAMPRLTLPSSVRPDELMSLVARKSDVLFNWTAKLYRDCRKKDLDFVIRMLKQGRVDLGPEFFIEEDDIEGFRLKMESYLRPEAEGADVPPMPSSVWDKSDEWVRLALQFIGRRRMTPSEASCPWSHSDALLALFRKGHYSHCLQLLDATDEALDACVFYGDDEFPHGPEKTMARGIIEALFRRHPQDENAYWSDTFVRNFLENASETCVLEAVRKTPQMLSHTRNSPVSMLIEAEHRCVEVAMSRGASLFISVVKLVIPHYCRKWTPWFDVAPEKFIADLRRTLERERDLVDAGLVRGAAANCREAMEALNRFVNKEG